MAKPPSSRDTAPPRDLEEGRSPFYDRAKTLILAGRLLKGWSQAKAAQHIGIPPQDYIKYEADPTRRIPAELLPDICDVLGIDLLLLMRGPEAIERIEQAKNSPKISEAS
jgi:transcriptional regulator with XRE-family HTH domain